ncbi:glycoside hydrolase family 9 protein [Streptomyces violascens]|uniref:Hydrolase n=1 Tax=Streptomyces violascens TaxID=67381 RepID=A0ABQ3QS83_9ACTN|nr:glycoside hydrolase family 9 protein [Streptomyces violascens]GGU48121.1 hydrolase [Streptomyces violascens]GHI40133.1 hydrolase [Streptomyces violascens]
MVSRFRRPRSLALGLALSVGAAGAVWYALPSREEAPGPVVIRADQGGYISTEHKTAFAMGPDDKLAGARFEVVDDTGRVALTGAPGPRTGAWNAAYDSVRVLDLSALTKAGTYQLRLTGTADATSPHFTVAPANELMENLAADNVRFFQAQRDGADIVPGALGRKPSHLADRSASVYAAPRYNDDGTELTAPLRKVGGPLDVSGGWFDAGDYLKFTHTASYATAQLLLAQRALPTTPGLAAEARHGLSWLDKMWDGRTRTLYAQVGIGAGTKDLHSDHDVWRLPEADNKLNAQDGDADHLVKFRPVFPANEPGAPLSPNLAGRVAAAFALAAQTDAARDPDGARRWLEKAAAVYGQADTRSPRTLVTTFPHAFYSEDSWQDDMEFGAAELALAAKALGDDRAARWQTQAGDWARAYLASGNLDTLGVSDVSALAHADLLRLGPSQAVVADLRRQLADGERRAAKDPFQAGAVYTDFDAVPHAFGLVATAALYAKATGDHHYDAFAAQQRGWALGANAWGTSFMIGTGEVFPRCPAHQVANLAGSLTGRGALLRGAVVNGPNGAKKLSGRDALESTRVCEAGTAEWKRFDGKGARYLDQVGAWQTVEPADDFTSTALLAFALSPT